MAIEVLRCPNCAAPLPAGARALVVCAYCNHTLTGVERVISAKSETLEPRRPGVVGLYLRIAMRFSRP